jgi:hypothetical protein
MAKPTPSQLSFEALIDEALTNFTPPRKGREPSALLLMVEEHFNTLHKAVGAGMNFKQIAPIFAKATGLTETTETKLRNAYTNIARKKGIKAPPKHREKKETPVDPSTYEGEAA